MSKRKVQFAEPPKPETISKISRKARTTVKEESEKNAERDEIDYNEDLGESGSEGEGGEEGNVLNMEELEVEEKTVEYDEEVKITPFNLDEEMEEGHFDKDGMFVFNKKSNIKDSWLDEYDFNDVQQLESARMAAEKRQAKHTEESAELEDEKLSDHQIYEQMATFLQPGENVLCAVRRLGNATKSLSASERLKLKKLAAKQSGQSASGVLAPTDVENQKKQLARLTELADLLVRRGHMNAYEETFESLQFQIRQSKKEPAVPASDMFSDEFVENEPTNSSANDTKQAKTSQEAKESTSSEDDVKWEYKMSTEDDSAIHGPVPTVVLMDLISAAEKEGKQPSTFYVRRHGTAGQFYNSSRVDFSLYTD